MAGTAASIADGEFDRVTMLIGLDRGVSAVAVRTAARPPARARAPPTSCGSAASAARPRWARSTTVATGGFSDVASDRGHAYYVDQCKGELGEVTMSGITSKRTNLGRATARRGVGRAGVDRRREARQAGAGLAGLRLDQRQRSAAHAVLEQRACRSSRPSTTRACSARWMPTPPVFNQLEVGAGGDYVATTVSSHYSRQLDPRRQLPADGDLRRRAARRRCRLGRGGAALSQLVRRHDRVRSFNDIMNWALRDRDRSERAVQIEPRAQAGLDDVPVREEMTRVLVLLCLLVRGAPARATIRSQAQGRRARVPLGLVRDAAHRDAHRRDAVEADLARRARPRPDARGLRRAPRLRRS